jgi:beta-lactamase regulating signal transducer with metallopeptidase domain
MVDIFKKYARILTALKNVKNEDVDPLFSYSGRSSNEERIKTITA